MLGCVITGEGTQSRVDIVVGGIGIVVGRGYGGNTEGLLEVGCCWGGVVVFIVEWVLWYYINDGRVIQQSTSVHGEDWIVTRPSFYPCELIPTPT